MKITEEPFCSLILEATQATNFEVQEVLQELWSGYGQILRLSLTGGLRQTVVAKFIELPAASHHPRGWNTDLSHQRKVRSYQVESDWYERYNAKCSAKCRTPQLLASLQVGEKTLLLLEDLDAEGYSLRLNSVSKMQVELCLGWLAQFHSTFLVEGTSLSEGLWKTGTYWHLATRPDELKVLDDEPLKQAAVSIDQELNQARFQTLVHGDAKLANFCFGEKGERVAALDFQYVGGGCGMKDVAYFLGSCLDEELLAQEEGELLDFYFQELGCALSELESQIDLAALEREWRRLFAFAWADFHRFLKGWSPTHWKLNSYSEQVTREVIALVSR